MSSNPVLASVLAQLLDARNLLECGTRLIERGEGDLDDRHLTEATCLRYGLNVLNSAYDALDRATFTVKVEQQ